jgi:hypothetical protein
MSGISGFQDCRSSDLWGAVEVETPIMGGQTGRSYAQDLRNRVLATVDGGMAVRQTVALVQVSKACIYKALNQRWQTGTVGSIHVGVMRGAI